MDQFWGEIMAKKYERTGLDSRSPFVRCMEPIFPLPVYDAHFDSMPAFGVLGKEPGETRRTGIAVDRSQWNKHRRLSPRQLQILQLIVDGKSCREIANQLEISPNTVAVHRAKIMAIVGVRKTVQLVTYAVRSGIVRL